ncbi:hypothetical protein EBZ80_12505, partial [bacterium]|nr:hypothetical protein [bacterium]
MLTTARELFSLDPKNRLEIVRYIIGRIADMASVTDRANLMARFLYDLSVQDPRPDANFYRAVLEIFRDEPRLARRRPRFMELTRQGGELNFRDLLRPSPFDLSSSNFFQVLAGRLGSEEAKRLVYVLFPQREAVKEPSRQQIDREITRLITERGLDQSDDLTRGLLREQALHPYRTQQEARSRQQADRDAILRMLGGSGGGDLTWWKNEVQQQQ